MKFTGANVGRHHRLLSEAVGLPSCVPAIPPFRTTTEVFLRACPQMRNYRPHPLYRQEPPHLRQSDPRLPSLLPGQVTAHPPPPPRGAKRHTQKGSGLGLPGDKQVGRAGERVAQNPDCRLRTGGAARGRLLTLYAPSSCNACGKFHHACEDQPA